MVLILDKKYRKGKINQVKYENEIKIIWSY